MEEEEEEDDAKSRLGIFSRWMDGSSWGSRVCPNNI